jgi:AbrB family looped-hinge helix DNA binding protein
MNRIRLSSKGRFVLPKSIREADGWTEGTEFVVERVREGVLLRPVLPLLSTRLEDVIGCAGYRGPARSITNMARASAEGVKARYGRH